MPGPFVTLRRWPGTYYLLRILLITTINRLIYFVESHLVWLVIVIAGLGLLFPDAGKYLEPSIGPLLALLMFIISLTFDAHDVRIVLRKPSRQFLALGLVYGPMSIAGLLTGRLFFGSGPLAAGQTLLGTLPTDVIDSLQLTDTHKVATPVDWQNGEDVIIVPSLSNEEAKERFPEGWDEKTPYLRVVRQPNK